MIQRNKNTKKPVEIFPWLYDISPFIKRAHPTYHPLSNEYERYWLGVEQEIVEGLWGLDSDGKNGGYRHMFGSQGFFINLGVVGGQSGDENTNEMVSPTCRDIEWVFHYGYNIARGFSGFIYDEKQTCHRAVKNLENVGYSKLSPKDKIILERHEDTLKTPKGDWKKYVEPLDYLYYTKPEPLGRPIFQNEALNFIVMGPRGYGKSWSTANILSYEFRVSGLRTFNDRYLYELPSIELVVISSDSTKSADLIDKFSKVEQHLAKLGEYKTDSSYYPGYFYLNCKGSLKSNNSDSPYTHRYAATKGEMWDKNVGTGNMLFHLLATSQNPDVVVGKRPLLIIHEEAALAPNEDQISKANQNSLKKESFIGTEMLLATGGNFAKIGPMKKKFLNPVLFRCVPYPDIFLNRKKPIGLMIPVTHTSLMFKDKNGNTKLKEAWEQEMHNRKALEDDPSELHMYKVYNCLDYEEMFGGATGNVFPTEEISQTILHIESNLKEYYDKWIIGEFYKLAEDQYEFSANKKYIPKIMNNPLEDKKTKNDRGIVIMQAPIKTSEAERNSYIFNPYKTTYDVIRDELGGPSLVCIMVYKGFIKNQPIDEYTDNIVAYYVGRDEDPEIMHTISVNLATLYGSKVLYENNIDDFSKFCKRKRVTHILQPTPWLSIEKIVKSPSKKKKYGVDMQSGLKAYAIRLLYKKVKEKVSYEGEVVMWIERNKMLRLLYELSLYGELNNYDAISAALILMIWLDQEQDPDLKEKYVAEQKRIEEKKLQSTKIIEHESEQFWGDY